MFSLDSILQGRKKAGMPFHPNYVAVLRKANALGYAFPSTAQIVKQNSFMVALVAAGIWSHIGALHVWKNSGSLNFASIDWKNLVAPGSYVNAPALTDKDGFQGNGMNSYFNSLVTAVKMGTQNDASHFGYCGSLDSGGATKGSWGYYDTVDQLSEFTFSLTDSYGDTNNSPSFFVAGLKLVTGFQLMRRKLAASYDFIQSGTTYNIVAASVAVVPALGFYVGGLNQNSVLVVPSATKVAFWGVGDSMNGLEAAFKTAADNFYAL